MGTLMKADDVSICQYFTDRLYTYSEWILMRNTMSQKRNLLMSEFLRRSSNATVKTPRPLDSHAGADEPQAARRTCDCRPPFRGNIGHSSWSRFSWSLKLERGGTERTALGESLNDLVPEAEEQLSIITVLNRRMFRQTCNVGISWKLTILLPLFCEIAASNAPRVRSGMGSTTFPSDRQYTSYGIVTWMLAFRPPASQPGGAATSLP
jgi:hypothetical protein